MLMLRCAQQRQVYLFSLQMFVFKESDGSAPQYISGHWHVYSTLPRDP